jgi:hypothetical protein
MTDVPPLGGVPFEHHCLWFVALWCWVAQPLSDFYPGDSCTVFCRIAVDFGGISFFSTFSWVGTVGVNRSLKLICFPGNHPQTDMGFRTTIPGSFLMESTYATTCLLLVVLVTAGTMVTGKAPNNGGQQHVSNSLLVGVPAWRKAIHQRHRSLESGVFSSFIRMLPNFALESTR